MLRSLVGSDMCIRDRESRPRSFMALRFMRNSYLEIIFYTRSMSPVSYTHLRAHETPEHLVCRLLLEKKKKNTPTKYFISFVFLFFFFFFFLMIRRPPRSTLSSSSAASDVYKRQYLEIIFYTRSMS